MAKRKELFKFNLLPKQTKEELQVYEERDVSIIYSFLMVFGAIFIFLVLNIVQIIFIEGNIRNLDTSIANTDQQIADFFSIKRINGELISKSRLLIEPLGDDIKINEFLGFADSLIGRFGDISSYDREPSGTFVLAVNFSSLENIQNAIIAGRESANLEDVFVRTIATQDSGDYLVKIAFNIAQTDPQI